jgi:DNA-binding NtrC family response regulator
VGSFLLVYLDPDTRDRIGSALRDSRHEVLTAHTARDAFLRVSEGGIDAVVIDSYDPRIAVVELAREMESLPDAPPIVLVSGSPHAPEISARIGAAAFVPKPAEPADVIALVERLVSMPRPVRTLEDFADEEPTGSRRQLG